MTPEACKHVTRAHDRPRVLLVEDDILVRWVTATFLRDLHFEVLEAADAHEAVAILRAGALINVVFSDVNMTPDMDGHALAIWIATHFPSLPVLLTSANPIEANRVERSSLRQFLSKPYDVVRLEDRLSYLIGPSA